MPLMRLWRESRGIKNRCMCSRVSYAILYTRPDVQPRIWPRRGVDQRSGCTSRLPGRGAALAAMSLQPRPHELVPRPGFESSFEGVYQQLTWTEEFDDCPNGGPDPVSWQHEVGTSRNNEMQEYREESSRCVDGKLVITAAFDPEQLPDQCRAPGELLPSECRMPRGALTSGSIVSEALFTQGQFDARIRINVQDASWPAWWFTGAPDGRKSVWPDDGGAPQPASWPAVHCRRPPVR
jgi:hypothetical protein